MQSENGGNYNDNDKLACENGMNMKETESEEAGEMIRKVDSGDHMMNIEISDDRLFSKKGRLMVDLYYKYYLLSWKVKQYVNEPGTTWCTMNSTVIKIRQHSIAVVWYAEVGKGAGC